MRNSLHIAGVLLFLILLTVKPTLSYAWHGHEHEHGHAYVGINLGVWPGGYYGPYSGPYYDHYYPDYVVVSPSPSYQPVVINGVTYYVNNGAYYIYTAYGYQAVAPPVVASAPVVVSGPVITQPVVTQPAVTVPAPAVADTGDTITINVPNDKGGYTAVVLKQSGKGYVGPQGEFYSEFPKVSQLKLMYGK